MDSDSFRAVFISPAMHSGPTGHFTSVVVAGLFHFEQDQCEVKRHVPTLTVSRAGSKCWHADPARPSCVWEECRGPVEWT